MSDDRAELVAFIETLAIEAGAVALEMRDKAIQEAETKEDGSPVTEADRQAEVMIEAGLAAKFPNIPIVGEERVSGGTMPDISGGLFWLVDPIDGTKDFVSGGPEFTVNIGLIEAWQPVAGVVYAPAMGQCYSGAVDHGATARDEDGQSRDIRVSGRETGPLRVVASRRHDSREAVRSLLDGQPVEEWVSISSSLKFCLVAAGQADLYPRLGPTHEWDTAAGDAIVRAAGGSVTTLEGDRFVYGKQPKLLNGSFIAKAYR
ncbi:MAG: 3'(2'),5'-bisphosphate nucleotidase CysQ [Pseudomonadota bacterium]